MPSDDPLDEFLEAVGRLVEDLLGLGPDGEGARPVVTAKGPTVDVTERDDAVEVVADLPVGSADAVDLACDGAVLHIEAGDADRRVDLPVRVDETSAEAAFKNGVLSVTFDVRDDQTIEGC